MTAIETDQGTDLRRDEDGFIAFLTASRLLGGADGLRLRAAREKSGESAVQLLSKLGILEEKTVADRLAAFLGLPRLGAEDLRSEFPMRASMSMAFLKEAFLLPVAADGETMTLAVADPFNRYAIDAVRLACGRRVNLAVAEASTLARALEAFDAPGPSRPESGGASLEEDRDVDLERLKDLAAEAPVIRLVNDLIERAVDMRASDIHLEPSRASLGARLRVDGLLRAVPGPPSHLRAAIVSRIKLMARLNIAERRLPQDGRIRVAVRGKEIDLRVATFPTMYGESVVLRILDKGAVALDLAALGLDGDAFELTMSILSRPTGIVLVTGPTGSGKTTTLYASLLLLARPETKVLTVEDPIEYELPGVNQTQVKPQIGLTFANALRSLLRQDPDVMLIGEIRDRETAEIAAQAALTGHKVLSTLHTNDAASSVTRLLDMGLPAFLVTATLNAVIAQRLVRVLCPHCKASAPASHGLAERLRAPGARIFDAVGCAACDGSGFKGRTGIYEVLLMSDGLRKLVHAGGDAHALRAAAIQNGMITLQDDGLRKAALGVTSLNEVLRVTGEA